jgi:8-oxo-dGTP pyrophosphatase MutT (NUDIX family)
VARLRTSTATSAGGIVVRYESGAPWLVVGSRRRERDGRTWTLPKGTPNAGESREETAVREVEEETGLKVRISGPLDSIEYTFVQSGRRIHKTVHYFLMDPVGGDLATTTSSTSSLDPVRGRGDDAHVRDRARARGRRGGPSPGAADDRRSGTG